MEGRLACRGSILPHMASFLVQQLHSACNKITTSTCNGMLQMIHSSNIQQLLPKGYATFRKGIELSDLKQCDIRISRKVYDWTVKEGLASADKIVCICASLIQTIPIYYPS